MQMTEKNRPEIIYCHPELAEQFNPLTALIASDLIYWLSHKGRRWARYKDFAALFGVSEVTAKRQKSNLEKIFNISRTTYQKGDKTVLGANEYKLKSKSKDLAWVAETDGVTEDMAVFPVVYTDIAKVASGGKANIDMAWFLARISHLVHKNGGNPVAFTNWAAVERLTQTAPRTAKRYLEQAEATGLLKSIDGDAPYIGINKAARDIMLAPFDMLEEKRMVRGKANAEKRMLGMVAFLSNMEPGQRERSIEHFDSICTASFGMSLSEFWAAREGLSSGGQADEAWGYDRLVHEPVLLCG